MAATEALGRPHARVTLGENDTPRRLRGREDDAPGCILGGLREAGVRNPVFLLEAIDRVAPDMAEALLDVLDPERCIAFEDQYVRVPFDLSAVLWIVTATDPDAIPEAVRDRLEVIALPGCTEQEKPAIAERHLLKRPFDARVPRSAGWLAPEPAAPSPATERSARTFRRWWWSARCRRRRSWKGTSNSWATPRPRASPRRLV